MTTHTLNREMAGKQVSIPNGILLIGGEWAQAASGQTFEDLDPATGTKLADIARGDARDVDRAVASAWEAFEKRWSPMAVADRARILYRISELILQQKDELAYLESLDTGKPLKQAHADVAVAARYFEYYAGVADKLFGQTIPATPGYLVYTLREPLGVCGHIIPWNYPLQIGSRTVAPALAAGNACVLKPAEEAPLTTLRLGEIALAAGLPPGVLNVVTGLGPEAGARLASHPDIRHVSFTGSVETGIKVMKMAADNVTPVTLELGGKSPHIVLGDVDLERAVPVIVNAIVQNAGQTCSAGSRLLVEERAHSKVVQAVAQAMERVRVGPGIEDPDMGPIISESQYQRVLGYLDLGRSEGAHILTGGSRPGDERLAHGYFVLPTVFDDAKPAMHISQEEIFGPVLTTLTFRDLDEALEIANGTPYGLVAAIWTQDVQKAHWLAARVKSGQVFINTYGAAGGVELPFGGYKMSGFGREKGIEALTAYTQVKTVAVYTG